MTTNSEVNYQKYYELAAVSPDPRDIPNIYFQGVEDATLDSFSKFVQQQVSVLVLSVGYSYILLSELNRCTLSVHLLSSSPVSMFGDMFTMTFQCSKTL